MDTTADRIAQGETPSNCPVCNGQWEVMDFYKGGVWAWKCNHSETCCLKAQLYINRKHLAEWQAFIGYIQTIQGSAATLEAQLAEERTRREGLEKGILTVREKILKEYNNSAPGGYHEAMNLSLIWLYDHNLTPKEPTNEQSAG